MGNFWQDLRYGLRTLAAAKGFTTVAVIALALGIGASTAIFSVVHALLLRNLPYGNAERIVMLYEAKQGGRTTRNVISPANFLEWKSRSGSFEHMALVMDSRVNLSGIGDPEEIGMQFVSEPFFRTLGTEPEQGRSFTVDEDRLGGSKVVVVSHGFWLRKLGGREALGAKLAIGGEPYTVVGVMPASFRFTNPRAEMWIPLKLDTARDWRSGAGRFMTAVASLKPGVPVEQASKDMSALAAQLEKEYPSFNTGWGVNVVPIREQFAGEIRKPLMILLGAVCLLLLIACANVANLLLARATVRQREIAIRTSLGASRARVLRQLLTESVILSLGAGVLGLLLAVWGMDALIALSPKDLALNAAVKLDWTVLGWTIATAVVTGLLFGLAPALTALRTDLTGSLKQGTAGSGAGFIRRMTGSLVVAEIALSLVLLAGAGVLVRSLQQLSEVDPGFDPNNLTTMRIVLPSNRYTEASKRVALYQQVLDRVRTLPRVESAGAVSFLPLAQLGSATGLHVEGTPPAAPGQRPSTNVFSVDADFFKAMRTPLLQGRVFDSRDSASAPLTFVVNDSFVKAYLPNGNPLGRRIAVRMSVSDYGEIVGVVGGMRNRALHEEAPPTVFYSQAKLDFGMINLIVRSAEPPAAIAAAVKGIVRKIDPEQPIAEVQTMDQVIAGSIARSRFLTVLLAIFAGIAFLLAAIGLYGVLSYSVTQRTREIGVRVALGATESSVLRLVLRGGMSLVAAGAIIGLLGAFVTNRLLETLLFGVKSIDPATFLLVPALLVAVGLLASYIPARRATALNPVAALRDE